MAKILLGPTVIGIRGTVGGMTFSQNRGGPYARSWHKPPNPRSTAQLAQRSNLAEHAINWRNLSAANKATWDAYAALPAQALTDSLGQTYYASGYNWYITTNTNLVHIGGAAAVAAPAGARPGTPIVTSFVWSISSTSQPRWTFSAASPPLALNHAMWLIIVNSQGILVEPAVLYFMGVAVPNVSRQIHCRPAAVAKFGTFTTQQKAFALTYAIGADGQSSPIVHSAVDATA